MESKPTVVTITGIRPDFIRMSEVFKRLDAEFNHILIHSGQHYDEMLSDVFFKEFNIRKPDYNLGVGGDGKEHFHQTAELTVKVITLLRTEKIEPKYIIFLGDSNTVSIAPALKKEGYNIVHIEAGMRSYDSRMHEETNRVICDHCSNILFVYHENYKQKLLKEGIPDSCIHVVGNTITEVMKERVKDFKGVPKRKDIILLDIHRPENFKIKSRLSRIIEVAAEHGTRYNKLVKMIQFPRTMEYIKKFDITLPPNVIVVPLMSFKEYTETAYHSFLMISDSGTAQEEAPFLRTHLFVPREFTERPESYNNGSSKYLNLKHPFSKINWVWLRRKYPPRMLKWLGRGDTAERIVTILKNQQYQ